MKGEVSLFPLYFWSLSFPTTTDVPDNYFTTRSLSVREEFLSLSPPLSLSTSLEKRGRNERERERGIEGERDGGESHGDGERERRKVREVYRVNLTTTRC